MADRLCVTIKEKSSLLSSYTIPLFKLPSLEVPIPGKNIRKFVIDHPKSNQVTEHKVLMVVGATGAGKSTLINGMVNFILGVQWDDGFRFKLILDQTPTRAKSITNDITAYTIHYMDGSCVPYSLTIIDTPGFGDAFGVERDKDIIQLIKQFFSACDRFGIDHLDAIGFATQAALVRLTPTQRYVFDSILSIFGKDVERNILIMVTFCDGKKPPVIAAIENANIPYSDYFKFNNSALYIKPSVGDDYDFDEMFWKMGERSFQKFFTMLKERKSISLTLTEAVLANREKLAVSLRQFQELIEECLRTVEVIRQEEIRLQMYEAVIAANKDFTYVVNVPFYTRISLPPGVYATNCLHCQSTCHENCSISNDSELWRCSAMNKGGTKSACCSICKRRCPWNMHRNFSERIELQHKEEVRHMDDLKKKFEDASNGKAATDRKITHLAHQLKKAYMQLQSLLEQARNCFDILQQTSLKSDPLGQVDYVQVMIESEKHQVNEGWRNRIHYLTKTMNEAVLIQVIVASGSNIDKQIKQEKEKKKPGWQQIVAKLEQIKQIQSTVNRYETNQEDFFTRMTGRMKAMNI